jgi:hypothetical protein
MVTVPGPKMTGVEESIERRSCFPDAPVDPTEAREATVRRFGRSDRSRLTPHDDIAPDEREVRVCNAAQFRPSIGLGPR